MIENFEKLGVFYLGRPFDLAKKKLRGGIVLYDSRDLVTHAVCVGMTGSGGPVRRGQRRRGAALEVRRHHPRC